VEQNIENVVDSGAEDNGSVVVEPSLASVGDSEVKDNESVAAEPNVANVMDAEAEDNEMEELFCQLQVNIGNIANGSQ
jgi:hypothetical protein